MCRKFVILTIYRIYKPSEVLHLFMKNEDLEDVIKFNNADKRIHGCEPAHTHCVLQYILLQFMLNFIQNIKCLP
jgi:hypothetical protein